MESNLPPKFAQKVFEGEGGSYYSWSSTEFELLKEAKVGGGRLVLQPRGFGLPHYADCNKIGYVLQGLCIHKLLSLINLASIRYATNQLPKEKKMVFECVRSKMVEHYYKQ